MKNSDKENKKEFDYYIKLNNKSQKDKIFEILNKTNSIRNIINITNNHINVLKSLKPPLYKVSETLVNSINSSWKSVFSTMEHITKQQLSLYNPKLIEAMTNPIFNIINQIVESQKELMNSLMSNISNNNPLFESLFKSLEEAKANPNSVYSWANYYDQLSEFFWIMPYKMSADELHEILSTVTTEKEFDRYIAKYFNKDKINFLISDIKKLINRKQDLKLFEQIVLAYDNKSYALASIGIMCIIDNLLSYYIFDKGCNSRVKLFQPIIKDIDKKREITDNFPFIVMMINSNINLLYENIEFNNKIKIETNKKSRRNPVAHGKSYSNRKIDTIMLLNTLYYLLIAKIELNEYKNSLGYDRNKKIFYILDKGQKQKLKNKIKENIVKNEELKK